MKKGENDKLRLWKKFRKQNSFYHNDLESLAKNLIPSAASVIEFGCKRGELLASLPNKIKVGVDDRELITSAKSKHRKIKFLSTEEIPGKLKGQKFDYIYLSNFLSTTADIQEFLVTLKKISHEETKIIIVYFNYFWKPLIDLCLRMGLIYPSGKESNWLSGDDINNLFYLEEYTGIKSGKRFLFPFRIPILFNLINKYLSQLPLINSLCITNYMIFKPVSLKKEYSVSVVIPARNEEGNMKGIIKKIPKLGKSMEIIFVEGHSKDATYKVIKEEIKKYKGKTKARLIKQKGIGKGDAVREGFAKARNELLFVFDSDLTVGTKDLPKFYNAVSTGKGDLVMGSRLIYPMEELAMRFLNILGNKFFSIAFTFLLDQKIRDTLCGTKVILRSKYREIEKNRKLFGDFDPFGDFDLIFGSAKLNYKILEIPVRYKQRVYGVTNISRFSHGLLLLKMAYFAARKIKFV